MDGGVPRLANTLPRRKKSTFALSKADWPASTSLCETLPATATTWLDIRSGILRAAERHTPCGSRESPKTMWTHEMEQAESAAGAAHKAHTSPHQETAYFEPNVPEEREEQNQALRRCFTMLLEARVEKLEASYSPRWRYLRGVAAPHPHPLESVVLRTDLRTASVLCLGCRDTCSFIILCGSHVPNHLVLLLLLAALLCPLVTGKWIGLLRRVNLAWPSATLRSAQPLATTSC
ncbi:hypothetical protein TcYC6_0118770 [Trypanosoma cruzi]|nr:hypothetical protein TcYC6_0118770 [Trypanosoma cruzi]